MMRMGDLFFFEKFRSFELIGLAVPPFPLSFFGSFWAHSSADDPAPLPGGEKAFSGARATS